MESISSSRRSPAQFFSSASSQAKDISKNSNTIKIDGNYYILIETAVDGNCGVDACKQLLACANKNLPDGSLSDLRKSICAITASSMKFSLKYGNASTIEFTIINKYLQQAFNTLADFISLLRKDLENKVSVEENECPKDNVERLRDLKIKKQLILDLEKCEEWQDLKALYDLDHKIFIPLIKTVLDIDTKHIFSSHIIQEDNLDKYLQKVSTSEINSWFTNAELISYLRYYGLHFEGYKIEAEIQTQIKGIILEFTNHEGKKFFLHSNASMNEQGFQEAAGGTHWQALSKTDAGDLSSRSNLTMQQHKSPKYFCQNISKEVEPISLPSTSVNFENDLMLKLESRLGKLSLDISCPVITVSELIAKIEALKEGSIVDSLGGKNFSALKLQLDEIRYYFFNPNFVTDAAYERGIAQLKDKYGADLLQIALMINSTTFRKRKLSEIDSHTVYTGFNKLVRHYKVQRAYNDIHKGKKFVKAGLPKFNRNNPLFHNNPIKDLSKQNISLLIEDLKQTGTPTKFGLRPDEIDLFNMLFKLPYKLQHATNAYYPILNSGSLDSNKEMKRKNPAYESSFSTKGNVEKLGNDGFVFFRLYVEPINNSQTRYGKTSLIFNMNLLLKDGWVSLHDQLIPFSTPGAVRFYQGNRLIRTAAPIALNNNTKDKTLHDGLLYKYRLTPIKSYNGRKDTQKSFGKSIEVQKRICSFLTEIFYGEEILLGIALSVIRELRYVETSGFRQHFLNKLAKASESEQIHLLGNLIKDLFRIEGKQPVGLRITADIEAGTQYFSPITRLDGSEPLNQPFEVINPDGDSSYNLDMSVNPEGMELAMLRAEKRILREEITNSRRQIGKVKDKNGENEEKIKDYNSRIKKMHARLDKIRASLAKNKRHRSEIIDYFCEAFNCREEIFTKVSTTKLEIINDYYSDWLEEGSVELTTLLNLPSQKLRLLISEPYHELLLEEIDIFDELVEVSTKDLIRMSEYDLEYATSEARLTLDELINLYQTDFTAFECATCRDLEAKMLEIAPNVDETVLEYALNQGVRPEDLMSNLNEIEQEEFKSNLEDAGYEFDDDLEPDIEAQSSNDDDMAMEPESGTEPCPTPLESTFLAMMGHEDLNNIKTNDPKEIEKIIDTLMYLRMDYDFPADFHNPRHYFRSLYHRFYKGTLYDYEDTSEIYEPSESDEDDYYPGYPKWMLDK
jgi:hypothetical protein